ncbi:MAG: beta-galactosidase [Candidatus Baltobacteraceae bacterium]
MYLFRFAIAVLLLATLLGAEAAASESWADWGTSSVADEVGTPVFTVDGKPFYVYGAAFFYERTPRSEWRKDLAAYKQLGINTIDLYVMWNWHEPSAGVIDFNGATNSRRDLHALFSIIHDLGFKTIVRPGPVIRNEWRNGGYPAWLLQRSEYAMPLHDILEGRYPATATYQNAHADAAAMEWMKNATHLYESQRWLQTVLREIEPWSHDVIAIALDDDQGAYIDNDTWPAPHWQSYIRWLRATVRQTVGARVPLFINTFQMKVTASAPVWAWGNWYQSDARTIGDHDIAQLAFSTALLQTQPHVPVMTSEFQAGWLQGADEIAPRLADPQNTTIALHEMLQYGARGVVNFPLADTLNPAGWEAPWTNWFYAWDAAFTLHGGETPRGAAVAEFGSLLTQHGIDIAQMQPQTDVAIAWLPSAYDPGSMSNARIGVFAASTIAALQRCRALARTCRLVDLKYDTPDDLARAKYLVLLDTGFTPGIETKLRSLARNVRFVASVDAAVAAGAGSSTGGMHDSALLVDAKSRHALLDTINSAQLPRRVAATRVRVGSKEVPIPAFAMPPQSAHDFWIDGSGAHAIALTAGAPIEETPEAVSWRAVPARQSFAYALDVYRDGEGAIVMDNGQARVVIAPDAGARAFVFESLPAKENLFTTIGALRDDVQEPLPPSSRDYIAAYTHPLEAGTFNRPYRCSIKETGARAVVECEYDAPDLASQPVHFQKTFVLEPGTTTLSVTVRASAAAVSLTALSPAGFGDVAWPADPQSRGEEIGEHEGYRLERLRYPANRDETIVFQLASPALKGHTRGEANRR